MPGVDTFFASVRTGRKFLNTPLLNIFIYALLAAVFSCFGNMVALVIKDDIPDSSHGVRRLVSACIKTIFTIWPTVAIEISSLPVLSMHVTILLTTVYKEKLLLVSLRRFIKCLMLSLCGQLIGGACLTFLISNSNSFTDTNISSLNVAAHFRLGMEPHVLFTRALLSNIAQGLYFYSAPSLPKIVNVFGVLVVGTLLQVADFENSVGVIFPLFQSLMLGVKAVSVYNCVFTVGIVAIGNICGSCLLAVVFGLLYAKETDKGEEDTKSK